jgi:hypothetical protein
MKNSPTNFDKKKTVMPENIHGFFCVLRYCNLNHYTLISTSTPLGNSNFIKASIVLEEEL